MSEFKSFDGREPFLKPERPFLLLAEEFHIQCAACGYKNSKEKFYNSSVHSKFKICPVCGTVKFVCEENRHYRKNGDKND